MKDYCVEVAYNLPDLVKMVQEMMKYDYKPVGGITLKPISEPPLKHRWEYMQAMFKDTTPKTR